MGNSSDLKRCSEVLTGSKEWQIFTLTGSLLSWVIISYSTGPSWAADLLGGPLPVLQVHGQEGTGPGFVTNITLSGGTTDVGQDWSLQLDLISEIIKVRVLSEALFRRQALMCINMYCWSTFINGREFHVLCNFRSCWRPEPVISLALISNFPQRRVWGLGRKRAANAHRGPRLRWVLDYSSTFALALSRPQPLRWGNWGSESWHKWTKVPQLTKTK